jgi:capsular exopolysaccharide synthesis family protein
MVPSQMTASAQMLDELPPAQPVDIRKLVGGLARRWKLIIAVPIVLLFVVYIVMQAIPSVYQANIQVLVFDPQQAAAVSMGEQAKDFDTVAINTEVEILKSETLSLQVAKELRLDQIPEFQTQSRLQQLLDALHQPRDGWLGTHLQALADAIHGRRGDGSNDPASSVTDPAAKEAARLALAARILRNRIAVDHVNASYVLVVSARANDPRLAERLVTTLIDVYFRGQRDAWRKALDEQLTRLSAKLAELATHVVETDTEIDKLRAKGGLGDSGKGSASDSQIAQLNTQLLTARSVVDDKRVRLEQARHLAASGGDMLDIPEALASPVISQLRLQQTQLTQEQAQLRARLGDRHAQVLAVGAQLADVNKALSDQQAHLLGDMQNAYDIAVRQEQSIEANMQRLTASLSNSGDYVKLQELQRSAAQDTKLYDAYLPQYDAVKTRESVGDIGQRVISPASVPSEPVSPPRKLIYAGAGFFGMALGVMIAFLAENLQGRMPVGSDAEQIFGYSIAGSLPFIRPRRRGRSRSEYLNLAQVVVGAPLSPFSEAVRSIRIGIRQSRPGYRPKIVLITSSLPGEGKSTVATLLAASGVSAGQRTILVDTDVRGRSVSRGFADEQPGLFDFLSGSRELASVIIEDPATGCHVIPVGSAGQSPADLLGSPKMRQLMQRLCDDYDYVVVDTAPILSVVDALVLAPLADKVLMVVDVSYHHNDSVTEAFSFLQSDRELTVGIVFNKVTTEQLIQSGYSTGRPGRGRDWLVEEPVMVSSSNRRPLADIAAIRE